MRISAESLESLRARTSMKWRAFPADVLPLPVAEMDFPLAEPIRAVLHELVDRSDTGYAPPRSELPEAFAEFAAARWGWRVDPEQLWTTTDVGVAIVEVLRRVVAPGSGVVITSPVYFPFYDLVVEAGGRVVDVPLAGGIDEGWSLDLDAIETSLAAGARAVLLSNPHNPVGRVHTREELAALADIAARHGAVVVSDEIHAPLTYPGEVFTPWLDVSETARDVGVTVTSASKSWNLAGLKCGFMVTDGPLARTVGTMPDEVYWRTSLFGIHANVAAFRHSVPWLDGVIATLDENRRLVADLLSELLPQARYRIPQATYLAWLDLRELGWGDEPADHARERARVALSPGRPFGREGFARINFATSPELLREAFTRLAAAR